MKIVYQEETAGHVIRYFANQFKGVKEGSVRIADWFYDPFKGTIVFKLYVDGEDKP